MYAIYRIAVSCREPAISLNPNPVFNEKPVGRKADLLALLSSVFQTSAVCARFKKGTVLLAARELHKCFI